MCMAYLYMVGGCDVHGLFVYGGWVGVMCMAYLYMVGGCDVHGLFVYGGWV